MKINSQVSGSQIQPNEPPLELKRGEVYYASVKERSSNGEAVVQIRGKEYQVKFEGPLPAQGEQVAIQMNNNEGKVPQVRVLSDQKKGPAETDISKLMKDYGDTYTNEQKQIAKFLADRRVPVSKETLKEVKAFMEASPGSAQQKLDTVKAIVNKGIEITETHLKSVHEALHGKSLPRTILSSVNPETAEKIELALKDAKQQMQLGREVLARERLANAIPQAVNQENENQLLTTRQIIHQVKQVVNREPRLEQVIHFTREQLANHPQMPQSAVSKLEQALTDATSLNRMGREYAGRERLTQALYEVEGEIAHGAQVAANEDADPIVVDKMPGEGVELQPEAESNMYIQPATEHFVAKSVLVTEITRRLSLAADQFKTLKREMTRNLDTLLEAVRSTPRNIFPQIKPLLESTIDILDKAILKSEITMLTDMGTEKELMKASSRLADARKLLANGDNPAAGRIIHEVKAQLERLIWKPSDTKVKHLIVREQATYQHVPTQEKLAGEYDRLIRSAHQQEPSARQTFELIRSLGLNHDSEVAQSLTAGKDKPDQETHQNNMKAVLLKLTQEEGGIPNPNRQQAEQALLNLTGQQLLSKLEAGSQMQSMLFNLPLALGAQAENVKVYVNSGKEGHKIDWENCSLYFLIETKRLGETGILITATDRNLSLTIKNDTPDFQERMGRVVDTCKERLKEIGYHFSGIHFTRLTSAKDERNPMEPTRQASPPPRNVPAKGFDFKI